MVKWRRAPASRDGTHPLGQRALELRTTARPPRGDRAAARRAGARPGRGAEAVRRGHRAAPRGDRKSTRLNSSHDQISYAVFCLKKKKTKNESGCIAMPEDRSDHR